MPPQKIFNKSQNFEFFQKRGLGGSKNEYFEKIFPKLKMVSKIGYKTCATLTRQTDSLNLDIDRPGSVAAMAEWWRRWPQMAGGDNKQKWHFG